MKLLAVDPGPDYYAYVGIDDKGALLDVGPIEGDVLLDFDMVVCEGITSYGQRVGAEVFETAYNIGALRQRCACAAVRFEIMPRIDVKLTLCGTARAKDADVRNECIRRLGPKGTKKNPGPTFGVKGDCWQALGLALAWLQKNGKKTK